MPVPLARRAALDKAVGAVGPLETQDLIPLHHGRLAAVLEPIGGSRQPGPRAIAATSAGVGNRAP